MRTFSYLALGDSYTIGEQVQLTESFPYQTVQFLRKLAITPTEVENPFGGFSVTAPEIIAKTGWTTDELSAAIGETVFLPKYDIVSLLIGVNNQYRGRSVEEFEKEFELLVQMAIQFANGIANNVYLLSIPDWSITPFAKDRDMTKISKEIDAFNDVCEKVAGKMKTNYINITNDQRADGDDSSFIAPDGLHPSGKEYKKWAEKLAKTITSN